MKLQVFVLQDLLNPDVPPDLFLSASVAFDEGKQLASENHTYANSMVSAGYGGVKATFYGIGDDDKEVAVCDVKESQINLNKNEMYDLIHNIEKTLHKDGEET